MIKKNICKKVWKEVCSLSCWTHVLRDGVMGRHFLLLENELRDKQKINKKHREG